MKLHELIGQTDLDMSLAQVKAFFLGVMSAERPLPFAKAAEEMMAESPEATKQLGPELKKLWDELILNKPAELQKMFPESANLNEFLLTAKDQLDFYLTALSLSGTNTETCKNEDVAELIDELEDTVMDLDEYLSESDPDVAEGEELKELLLEAWQDYLKTTSK
jgi:hypothetical protein